MSAKSEPLRWTFGETASSVPVIGMHAEVSDQQSEIPVHQHSHAQMIISLKGAVTCEVPKSVWMVPPHCAVWIPGEMPHSIRATANSRVCYLFVAPGALSLSESCCTIAISPLVRELILDIADRPSTYALDSTTALKARVLLAELQEMPIEHLYLPTSSEPRMHRLTEMLLADPGDRRTLEEWGKHLAMSERSLARLVVRESGLSFGRWRQQLHLIVAMRQLAAGDTVQRVANHLGYDSVNAFITMFKKIVGKPPARYFAELEQSSTS
ncbi:helix-turn-helix transcriptional regulator [Herbaspirillum sp. LeCh32-8]|uniref:AraC family transcriptional regulator n=1 Tax=Herbaspirillum sp. LeCh32-8 TaxID=2821356 RepID=UPI001FD7287E|nr:helix-turn-helix transcriptional regulator [Herbaspirillum sp. LeCh32-8]